MFGEKIKTGRWINTTRIQIYPVIFLTVSLSVFIITISSGEGMLDANGQLLGADFIGFWSVSKLIVQGSPAAVYDYETLYQTQRTVGVPDNQIYICLYPPLGLLIVAPLALLPYFFSLALWISATFVAYLSMLRRFLPDRRAMLSIIAFPPLFINFSHGQNGFLSAALLGWSLVLMPKYPRYAGILVGILAYKPQLGLLLPIVLLAEKNWRTFISAGLTVVVLSALTYLLFGIETWTAFLAKSDFANMVIEQGLVPWQKMISSFAAARLLGAPVGYAWGLQLLVSMGTAYFIWQIWRSPTPYSIKVAALATGTLLVSPFILDYDATILGIALISFVADGLRRGFLDWEISALALAWIAPFIWRPLAITTNIPLAPLTIILLFCLTVRRAKILAL